MPGYTETSGRRLIPSGVGHQLYSITSVEFGTTDFYGPNLPVVEYNTIPFAISVKADGVIELAQTAGTETLNPADTIARTLMTIQSYKTWTTNGQGTVIISNPITAAGGGTIKVKAVGQTVVLDTTPPVPVAISPNTSGISVDVSPTLTFSESVVRGASGTITLWNETLNSSIEVFNVATAPTSGAGSLAVSLNQVVIDPTNALPSGCQISVKISAGALKDLNNNSIVAVTGSLWSFTTQPAIPVTSTMTPDVVVSAGNINSILTSWAADPVGTAPAGKSAYERRVIGYNTIPAGLTISNKNMPMEVYIRPVGTYGFDVINGWNEPSCSTYINGVLTISNSNNIYFFRSDIRASGTGTYNSGICQITNCTNSGVISSVIRGWPHQLVQGSYGTTATGIKQTGGSNITIKDVVTLFIYDSDVNTFGTTNGLLWSGIMGRHSGGNSLKVASFANVTDLTIENCMQDRVFHPYKGLHGDWLQVNNNNQVANDGGILNRLIIRKNIGYRGHWTGSYNANTNGQFSNVTQFAFINPAEPISTGPHLFEQNLVVTGQANGVTRIPGSSVLTTRYNTMLDSVLPVGQTGQAPFPRIKSTDVSSYNFITGLNYGLPIVANEGTNGIVKLVSVDHHEILDEHMAIPTDLTDLYDIRPKSGTVTDPFYSTPANRVGCYDMWGKLFLGDATMLPSKRGWPVDRIFIEDFDPSNRFGATAYTGAYDVNGDAA